MKQSEILEKLLCRKGHQNCRIRPFPFNPDLWLAEVYGAGSTSTWQKWKPLAEEKTHDRYRTFTTPQEAHNALIAWRGTDFSS